MHLVSQGRGKGIATYYTNDFKVSGTINKDHYQISRETSNKFDVINIYCSQGANKADFLKDLGGLACAARPTFMVGDFNMDFLHTPKSPIITKILSNGFRQIVTQPTHIEGGLLDHVYIKRISFEPMVLVHFPYYSDHGSLSIVNS